MWNRISEAQSCLWSNELLKALVNDPSIGQDTKNICKKLKFNSNQWQSELKEYWSFTAYPEYDQTSILKLNATLHKFCQRINFYLNQGNTHAASLIPDIADDSVTAKQGAIVLDDYSCQGWDPVQREFVTIAYHKKACLEDMDQRIECCVQSGAINIPKSLSNIIAEGRKKGFMEKHYNNIWLSFIQK